MGSFIVKHKTFGSNNRAHSESKNATYLLGAGDFDWRTVVKQNTNVYFYGFVKDDVFYPMQWISVPINSKFHSLKGCKMIQTSYEAKVKNRKLVVAEKNVEIDANAQTILRMANSNMRDMMEMRNAEYKFKLEELEVHKDRIDFKFTNGIVSIGHDDLYNYVENVKYKYNGLHTVIVALKNMGDFGCAYIENSIAYINKIECALWKFVKSENVVDQWIMDYNGNFVKRCTTFSTYLINGIEMELKDTNKFTVYDTDKSYDPYNGGYYYKIDDFDCIF